MLQCVKHTGATVYVCVCVCVCVCARVRIHGGRGAVLLYVTHDRVVCKT